MDYYFFVVAIVLIVVLIAIRVYIRHWRGNMYVEVFQTTSRDISTSEALTNAFGEEGIRYHIVYKGPPNQPYIGMSGEQFVSLEVHAEDLVRARQVVSEVLEHVYRNR